MEMFNSLFFLDLEGCVHPAREFRRKKIKLLAGAGI